MPNYKAERDAFYHARSHCRNPKNAEFSLYGGRGIEFHFDSFEDFFDAVGPRPTPRHSIDRIDNFGHYERGNLRWATQSEQCRNRRQKPNRTGYQCVYQTKGGKYYTALWVGKKRIGFPAQDTSFEAAITHDVASLMLLGPDSQMALPEGMCPVLIGGEVTWPEDALENIWQQSIAA